MTNWERFFGSPWKASRTTVTDVGHRWVDGSADLVCYKEIRLDGILVAEVLDSEYMAWLDSESTWMCFEFGGEDGDDD